MQSLGFIETKGFVAAVEAADTALKAANVTLVGRNLPGAGLVAVIITGDVAAVKAAVEAGAAAAARVGKVNTAQVIAGPHPDMAKIVGIGASAEAGEAKPGPKGPGKTGVRKQENSPGV
jgi:ethanolamine utilization protein EutM